jgi:hypothetical protein
MTGDNRTTSATLLSTSVPLTTREKESGWQVLINLWTASWSTTEQDEILTPLGGTDSDI